VGFEPSTDPEARNGFRVGCRPVHLWTEAGFGSASVRLEALRCAEVGTKFGTKSLRCRVLTLIREREPRGRYQDRLAPADQPRGHVLLKGGEQFVQCAVSVSLTLDRLRVGRTLGADS
jgi:hypothetical protein